MEQEKKERRQHGFHPLQDIGQLFLSLYNSMKKGLRGVGVLASLLKQSVCERIEDCQLRQKNQKSRKQILRMEDEQSQQIFYFPEMQEPVSMQQRLYCLRPLLCS